MAAEEDAGRVLLLPFLLPLLRIAINEGGDGSSGPASRLIRPKTEPALGPVKCEHNDEAAFDDEAAMKWAREDWARLEMERQRHVLEENRARPRTLFRQTACGGSIITELWRHNWLVNCGGHGAKLNLVHDDMHCFSFQFRISQPKKKVFSLGVVEKRHGKCSENPF